MSLYSVSFQPTRPHFTTCHEPPHKPRGVTGRDGYIVAQALWCFISAEQAKPDHECAWSDLQDARALFNALCGIENAGFFAERNPDQTVSLVDEKEPKQSE